MKTRLRRLGRPNAAHEAGRWVASMWACVRAWLALEGEPAILARGPPLALDMLMCPSAPAELTARNDQLAIPGLRSCPTQPNNSTHPNPTIPQPHILEESVHLPS